VLDRSSAEAGTSRVSTSPLTARKVPEYRETTRLSVMTHSVTRLRVFRRRVPTASSHAPQVPIAVRRYNRISESPGNTCLENGRGTMDADAEATDTPQPANRATPTGRRSSHSTISSSASIPRRLSPSTGHRSARLTVRGGTHCRRPFRGQVDRPSRLPCDLHHFAAAAPRGDCADEKRPVRHEIHHGNGPL
jgi:hypothetical protein